MLPTLVEAVAAATAVKAVTRVNTDTLNERAVQGAEGGLDAGKEHTHALMAYTRRYSASGIGREGTTREQRKGASSARASKRKSESESEIECKNVWERNLPPERKRERERKRGRERDRERQRQ